MNGRVGGVLGQQAFENAGGDFRLAGADERGAPGEEQAGVVWGIFGKRLQDFDGLQIFFGDEITQTEKLANEGVVGMGGERAF